MIFWLFYGSDPINDVYMHLELTRSCVLSASWDLATEWWVSVILCFRLISTLPTGRIFGTVYLALMSFATTIYFKSHIRLSNYSTRPVIISRLKARYISWHAG